MKIATNFVPPTMSGVGEIAKATIKASPRLFKFFSDMIYADKFVAILRELVANGVDAQVAAGNKDKPVLVTLPTAFTPYAKVRDYGTGMTHEFLMGPFMAYTDASTKENSNDYIGGFGIGSKAPLSYTEQFAIHSYVDGILRVYSIFKDEDDCPAIAFLSETSTNEPDGVEISFPVEQGDITKFKEAALKCLRYFDPLPILRNCDQQLEGPTYTVRASTFGFRKGESQSQIVQGGVAYPIDKDSVPRPLHDILDFGIDFYVPIGSVGIALSRERLSYDDATVRVLTSLCEGIRPQIKEHIDKMFDSYKTKWEALRAYNEAVYGNTSATRLIEQFAEYKGQKLTRYMPPVHSDKVLCAFITNSRWSKRGRNSWTASRASPQAQAWIGEICPKDIDHILIDDAKDKPVLRMRNFLENMSDTSKGVMIVRKRPDLPDRVVDGKPEPFINDLDWATFIKDMGSPPVLYLSKIEPAIVSRNGTSIRRPERIRAYTSAYRSAKFIDTLPLNGGYYVEMENFHITGISNEQIKALDLNGKPLLYFNKGDVDVVKKHPDWKSALDRFNEQKAEYKKTHKNLPLVEAFCQLKNPRVVSYGSDVFSPRLISLLGYEGFACPKRGPLNRLNTLFQVAAPQLNEADNAMRRLLGIEAETKLTELRAIVTEIKQQYPELNLQLKHNYPNEQSVSVYNKLIK
jgi:hypothetical protein